MTNTRLHEPTKLTLTFPWRVTICTYALPDWSLFPAVARFTFTAPWCVLKVALGTMLCLSRFLSRLSSMRVCAVEEPGRSGLMMYEP